MKVRSALTVLVSVVSDHFWAIVSLPGFFLVNSFFRNWKYLSGTRSVERRLLSLYTENTENSDALLRLEIQDRLRLNPPAQEREVLVGLLGLLDLRKVMFRSPRTSKEALQEAFILRGKSSAFSSVAANKVFSVEDFSIQDIADAATVVSGLLWKTHQIARENENPLSKPASQLLEEVGAHAIETLTDSIQREGGIPFLLLNLVAQARWDWAKPLGQRLLTSDLSLEEESRACLYWMTEIEWFTKREITVPDFETTIRYLYHLCFINPERAGFLEIDSQFFSQFETVNELAREGFLFKETLIERVLYLWGEQPSFFDRVFRECLQILTQQKSKIYQDRESWLKWWEREKDDFEKEYLFVVEGNLHYASGQFKEALEFYDKALRSNAHLRPAILNRLFCLAKTNQVAAHQKSVDEISEMKSLYPSSLSVIGNSFLLLGKDEEAEKVYADLARVEGWARKTDYYQSTFCFENGLFEKALFFALRAHQANPEDLSVGFHLSQCYSALGKKGEALEILKALGGSGPQWLHYYRFTLERDSGRLGEAHQTLLQIPIEYFDDPDELEAALDFAKNSSDLNLLRRLKSRG